MNLKEKVVILTGATGGMGREVAKELDKKEANLVLISRSEDELKTLIKSLNGKNNLYLACDLSNQEATRKLGEEIAAKFKNVDILINAAGIGIYKPIEDITFEDWNNTMNININAAFILTKSLVENLKRSDGSVVISLGSGNGGIPVAGRSPYCTSKFALRGWSLAMSEEFRGTNVDFCLMTLGSVLTSFGPMSIEEKKRDMESGKGYLTPEWVAQKLVEILLSNKREREYKFYPSGYEPQN